MLRRFLVSVLNGLRGDFLRVRDRLAVRRR